MPYDVTDRVQLYINKDTSTFIRVVQINSEYKYDKHDDKYGGYEPFAGLVSDGAKSSDVIVEVASERDAMGDPIWRHVDLSKKEK